MALILDGILFELNTESRSTAFFIHNDDDEYEFSLDCYFHANIFMDEEIKPYLCINAIPIGSDNMESVTGKTFEVKNIEEAMRREDTLCVFEHEPLESYKITVIEFKNDRAHIKCSGIAVTDGYARPYKTAKFELDCWLPVITNVNDWGKFGL